MIKFLNVESTERRKILKSIVCLRYLQNDSIASSVYIYSSKLCMGFHHFSLQRLSYHHRRRQFGWYKVCLSHLFPRYTYHPCFYAKRGCDSVDKLRLKNTLLVELFLSLYKVHTFWISRSKLPFIVQSRVRYALVQNNYPLDQINR